MSKSSYTQHSPDRRFLLAAAWISMFLVSDLPDIVWKSISGQIPGWLPWAKVALLGFFLGLCVVWKKLRPLRSYAFVMPLFFVALGVSAEIGSAPWWRSRFDTEGVTFFTGYLGAFIRDAGVALVVVGALFMVKRRRGEFFLVKGRLDAPIEPVRWLGIRSGESWRIFGWIFALVAAFGVFFPTFLSLKPSAETLARAAPLLPAVLFFAAVNALTEEIYFRASLLAVLPDVIGKTHTLLIASVFFGLSHWLYGSPGGLPGFLMTGFLGWILGKCMLETRGFLWPWFIHFVPDVVIFASYAVLWAGR